MLSIPRRIRRPALWAVVALVTVGGSMSAASAQPYGGDHDRRGDDWHHAQRYHQGQSSFQRHCAPSCYPGVYGGAYPAPVYYGGHQTGDDDEPPFHDGDEGRYYPAVGYDWQGYEDPGDDDRAQSEWRDEGHGYDEDE